MSLHEFHGLRQPTSPVDGAASHHFGVATTVPKRGQSKEALIQASDEALYKSKRGGRNRYTTRSF